MAFLDDNGNFYRPSARPGAAPSSGGANPYPVAAAPPGVAPPPPPNWQDILNNNPYYLAAQALSAQQLAALKAQTGSSAARALVNLGDAGLAKQVGGLDIPGNTGALVDQANTAGTSVLAQLGHAHGQLQQQIPAQLAGRGFYRSGETGYELGQENRQYGLRQESARQQTLDYLNNLYSNYVNAQFGIQQNEMGAYLTAYQQAMSQLAQYGGGSQVVAPPSSPGGSPYIDAAKKQGLGSNQSFGQSTRNYVNSIGF